MAGGTELEATLGLLEAQLTAEVAARAAPGLSVAVVRRAETIWARGFGHADLARGTSADADTIYEVASITKLFTATMLMQLRDAGALRLDDPVRAHLPDLAVPRRHDGAPEITFRHLVTHTSGLAKEAPLEYWDTLEFPDAERLLASLPTAAQPFPPGTRWKYSNLGFALLGHALARIAGTTWERYVAERILRPLGMARSAPRLTDQVRAGLATGYHRPVDGWPPRALAPADKGGLGPAGGLCTSAADLARYLAEHLAPAPTLLSPSSIAEMRQIQWIQPDWQLGWGIAWFLQRAEGGARLEHGGSLYGYTSKVLLSPADGLGVVVLTNTSDSTVPRRLAATALDLLVGVERRAAARRPIGDPPARRPDWEPYVGRYRWVFADAEVALRDDTLLLRMPEGPGGEEIALRPDGPHRFLMPTGPLCGEWVRFVVDPAGRVTSAWIGPHPHQRL